MFRGELIIAKKGFTLVEIILVVIIISIVYGLFIVKIGKSTTIDNTTTLLNLKSKLLQYNFNDQLVLKCVDDGKKCYIFVDGVKTDTTIKDLFETKPTVYSYDKTLQSKEFLDLQLEHFESYEVPFEYRINKDGKGEDMIVEVGSKVYIFNSIEPKPIVVEYLSDVIDYFEAKEEELKNAF